MVPAGGEGEPSLVAAYCRRLNAHTDKKTALSCDIFALALLRITRRDTRIERARPTQSEGPRPESPVGWGAEAMNPRHPILAILPFTSHSALSFMQTNHTHCAKQIVFGVTASLSLLRIAEGTSAPFDGGKHSVPPSARDFRGTACLDC